MLQRVKLAVVGAGQRGVGYASYGLDHPYEVEIVAVAEPDPARLQKFQAIHDLPAANCYTTWQDLLTQPRLADALLICTQDREHFEPAMAALEAGYHVLLEKPMSPDPLECIQMGQRAQTVERIFSICHVLRYTSFFSTLKQLLVEGAIGRLISIQHNENVAFWHYAHSFVRGNWRDASISSPMILAKSCHDMDILLWLADAECLWLSSFGSLTHFTAENAPPGAPLRCLDGCPVAHSCPYYAPKAYLTGNPGWPASTISLDTSRPALLDALTRGPYGRCVYHCDNNVVDHQVVNMEFANNVTAVFTMSAFTNDISRSIKLMGTKGELWGSIGGGTNQIELLEFATGAHKVITLRNEGGHGGGDYGLIRDFIGRVQRGNKQGLTSANIAVQSHLLAFAAEEARLEKRVVNMRDFAARVQQQA